MAGKDDVTSSGGDTMTGTKQEQGQEPKHGAKEAAPPKDAGDDVPLRRSGGNHRLTTSQLHLVPLHTNSSTCLLDISEAQSRSRCTLSPTCPSILDVSFDMYRADPGKDKSKPGRKCHG